ncbi:hypothetical protein [Nocardia sp. NPDC004860]|uniref:hypothetical protein n=1 Tax=Nocardia sp. NPDC004860 TaxID=3154557 RepID=UPI0033BC43A9
MRPASAVKIALMCAATATAATAMAAPAHADLYPGACLYVDNQTSSTATITVHSSIVGDIDFDIDPYQLSYLTYDGNPISTVTGGWNISYSPSYAQGSWRYESDWAPASDCNGSWVFTMS